jgi:histidine ammonia-lyase
MNSSITPLSLVVQCDRPGKWLNWDAGRILDMLKGSYLFDGDTRIIQDPESLRASSIRAGSAWEEWAALRDAVLFQANTSDHNPAVHVGMGPEDSWELATPQLMKFYVKGGPQSHGQHGYIVSNANWDPYPMANKLENFVIALGNLDVAVMLRIDRFTSPFFTVVEASQVLPDIPHDSDGYTPPDLQQEIQSLSNPVAPSGSAIESTVEDLQAQTRIKVLHARQAVSTTLDLLGHDLLQAGFWIDVRKKQDASRDLGKAPTAAWTALRKIVPLKTAEQRIRASQSDEVLAAAFVHSTDPETFYSSPPPPRSNDPVAATRCR